MGAEYSDQKSDKGNYNTSYPGYPGTTTGGFNSDCAINDAWCTSLTNPNSKDQWLGTAIANKATTTTKTKVTSVYLLDNIELNPKWLVDLGARWDKFDTEQVTHATGQKLKMIKTFYLSSRYNF